MTLKRSNNKMMAGVCGGLAEWLGWDATIVRIAYVLISIFSAAFPGILVYIILWLVMPPPDSFSEWWRDILECINFIECTSTLNALSFLTSSVTWHSKNNILRNDGKSIMVRAQLWNKNSIYNSAINPGFNINIKHQTLNIKQLTSNVKYQTLTTKHSSSNFIL